MQRGSIPCLILFVSIDERQSSRRVTWKARLCLVYFRLSKMKMQQKKLSPQWALEMGTVPERCEKILRRVSNEPSTQRLPKECCALLMRSIAESPEFGTTDFRYAHRGIYKLQEQRGTFRDTGSSGGLREVLEAKIEDAMPLFLQKRLVSRYYGDSTEVKK